VPLRSDVGCASGKNIDCAYIPESSRALRLLRPRVFVLFAWPQLVLLPGSVACASSAATAAALCAPAQTVVRRWAARGGGWRVHLLHRQECPQSQNSVLVVSQKILGGMDAVACRMSSTTIVQIALTCEREMPTASEYY
jgi:hypothetical protein